jgi:thioredoxin-like negative regulator of GroEL
VPLILNEQETLDPIQKIEFQRVDVEAEGEFSAKFSVQSIPTFILMKDEKEVDSDGFEIVSTVKTKPEDFKPKKKYYNNEKRDKRDFKKGDRGGQFKKPFNRKQDEEKQEEKVQSGDEQQEQQQPIQKEDPKEKIADKKTIKIDAGVKKLKDLFA